MKKIILLLLWTSIGFSQSINDYQYVVVPTKFSFKEEINPFRLSTNSKFMLSNIGFTVFYDNAEFPKELASDNCKALFFDIIEKNTMMSTNLTIELKDCTHKIIFTSVEGKSREKDFAIAYNDALNQAFASLKLMKFKCNNKSESSSSLQSGENSKNENQYFAQPTSTGFQLVDKSPKEVFNLFKTSQKDLYLASSKNKNGVVYLKNGNWIFEYYENEKLISEKIDVKF